MNRDNVTTVELLHKPDDATIDQCKKIYGIDVSHRTLVIDFSEEDGKFSMNASYNPNYLFGSVDRPLCPPIEEVYKIGYVYGLPINYPGPIPVEAELEGNSYFYVETPFEVEMAYIIAFSHIRRVSMPELPTFLEYTPDEDGYGQDRLKSVSKEKMTAIIQRVKTNIDILSLHL